MPSGPMRRTAVLWGVLLPDKDQAAVLVPDTDLFGFAGAH
jgi:hypothetical protein